MTIRGIPSLTQAVAALATVALTAPPATSQIAFMPPRNVHLGSDVALITDYDAADVDHDGQIDVVLMGPFGNEFARNLSDGVFDAPDAMGMGSFVPRFADANGDGHLDIVAKGGGHALGVALGMGDGTFGPLVLSHPQGAGFVPASVQQEVADLTGDGHVDVLVLHMQFFGVPAGTTLTLYPGTGDGLFGDPITLDAAPLTLFGTSFATGDIEGDGDIDIVRRVVTGPANQADVLVLMNDGAGTFTAVTDNHPAGMLNLTAFDADGDGMLDLVGEGALGGWVAIGKGDGTFEPSIPSFTTAAEAVGLHLSADFDGDGLVDLVRRVGDDVLVHESIGDGTFGAPVVVPGMNVGIVERALDLNGDGRVDLITPEYFPDTGFGLIVALNVTYPAEAPFNDRGGSLPGPDRMLQIAAGSLQPGAPFSIVASGTPLDGLGWLVIGIDQHDLPFAGGAIGPSMDVIVGPIPTGALRRLTWESDWPAGIPSGVTLFSQAWSRDTSGTWAATTTVETTMP